MKSDKGFSLVEVVIAISLSTLAILSIAAILLFGQKNLDRILNMNKDGTEIMIFRSHIEARLQKITGKGFLIGDIVSTDDVKFIEWREYVPDPDVMLNGLPNFNTAGTPFRTSDWTNLVGTKVVFNSIDPTTGDLIRCLYIYNPARREVEYREYTAPLNASGQESDLDFTFPPPTTLRLSGIILRQIVVFQIGCSNQGLPDWEIYGTRANSQAMTNPMTDAYIRVFVRTENDDARYRTNKSFISRSTRREYTCWTPPNEPGIKKVRSFEYDPTLVDYMTGP